MTHCLIYNRIIKPTDSAELLNQDIRPNIRKVIKSKLKIILKIKYHLITVKTCWTRQHIFIENVSNKIQTLDCFIMFSVCVLDFDLAQ